LSETGGVIKNAKACGLVKETCTNKSSPQCAADLLKVVSSDADLRKAFYLSFFMGALDGEELVAMMKKNGIANWSQVGPDLMVVDSQGKSWKAQDLVKNHIADNVRVAVADPIRGPIILAALAESALNFSRADRFDGGESARNSQGEAPKAVINGFLDAIKSIPNSPATNTSVDGPVALLQGVKYLISGDLDKARNQIKVATDTMRAGNQDLKDPIKGVYSLALRALGQIDAEGQDVHATSKAIAGARSGSGLSDIVMLRHTQLIQDRIEADSANDRSAVAGLDKLIAASEKNLEGIAKQVSASSGTPISFSQVQQGEDRITASLRNTSRLAELRRSSQSEYIRQETSRAMQAQAKRSRGAAGR
jgi:hypothetical protein